MSRRYSSRTRVQPLPWDDIHQAHWGQVGWWWDEIPGYEPYTWSEWQDAWAESVTLPVIWAVWRRTGSRMYAVQRDALLREDLQSWLALEAQKVASKFTPDPTHPAPQAQWGAYLSASLESTARWHFGDVIGKREEDQAAHNSWIASTDALDALEAEEGRATARHALHGNSFGSENPLAIIVRTENLLHDISAYERHHGEGYTTNSTHNGICLELGCHEPHYARGMCKNHWDQERELWGTGEECLEEGCRKMGRRRGWCQSHYVQNRQAQIEAGTWQPRQAIEGCSVEGCDRPHKSGGMCGTHHEARRRANLPPCSEEGCTSPTRNRGLCYKHYKARLKKGLPLPKKGGGG